MAVNMSDSQPGTDQVLVNVEGVFDGGMIVAFKTPEGCEFRGALLQTSCSKSEEISTKMPPRLFLKWNNVPPLYQTLSSPRVLHSRTQYGKVEYSPPVTVVASVNSPRGDCDYSWPYVLINSQERTAKCVAQRKIQEIQDLDNLACPERDKNVGKVRKKKVRHRSLANSLASGKKRRLRLKGDTDLQLFERKRRKTHLSPRCKVALKELSIPLVKVPIHVKKRNLEDSNQSTSSSRSSTVDGVAEVEQSPSYRLSSTPLSNNSSEYIIIID